MALDQRAANLPLFFNVGDDASVSLTVTENGSAWVSTGATGTSAIIDVTGTVVATNFTTAVSTGALSFSLTRTQLTTLGAGTFTYWVAVTKSGLTRTWVAGKMVLSAAGTPGVNNAATASLSLTNGTVSLSFTSLISPDSIWLGTQTLNAQTGTTYTIVAGDLGKLVTLTNASAVALTVPAGLGLAAGQRIDLAQLGAGQVTVAGSGATVNATPGLKLRAQYSAATLLCTATNVYLLVGDLSA